MKRTLFIIVVVGLLAVASRNRDDLPPQMNAGLDLIVEQADSLLQEGRAIAGRALAPAPANESGAGTTGRVETTAPATARVSNTDQRFAEAWQTGTSNLQLQGGGSVSRVLADDNDGSPHQRFIVRLESGQTLLVAHNLDLAPRVPALSAGEQIEFYGEYEWNAEGGVMHWTHDDPQGRHPAGWLRYKGRTYQ